MSGWQRWRRKLARKHYYRGRAARTGHALGGVRTWALSWAVEALT